MRNRLTCLIVVSYLFVAISSPAQQADPAADTPTAMCTFDDEKQMSVQYGLAKSSDKLPNGKVWTPGGKPMFLFTQADLVLANTAIPVGAYSMFVIPGKNNWTLIVNRNVDPSRKYDEKQDLVRAPMDIGQLGQEEKLFTVVFGHLGPKMCTMRFYFGKTGAFTEFNEK